MIKIDKKVLEFSGSRIELITELTAAIRAFFNRDVIDEEDLADIVRVAKMSDEEVAKNSEEIRKNLIKEFDKILSDISAMEEFLNKSKEE